MFLLKDFDFHDFVKYVHPFVNVNDLGISKLLLFMKLSDYLDERRQPEDYGKMINTDPILEALIDIGIFTYYENAEFYFLDRQIYNDIDPLPSDLDI